MKHPSDGVDLIEGIFMNMNNVNELVPIIGFEELYSITDNGLVWSNISNKFLKYGVDSKGYFIVDLHKNKKGHTFSVHRLVAIHFIENKEEYNIVNHIDGNKKNNAKCNLEWCTAKHNINHSWAMGLSNSNHKKREIICVESGIVYESIKYASDIFGLNRRSIINVLNGKQEKTKGYTFKYV